MIPLDVLLYVFDPTRHTRVVSTAQSIHVPVRLEATTAQAFDQAILISNIITTSTDEVPVAIRFACR